MEVEGVRVFLSVELQNLSEYKVKYYVGVAKAKFPQDTLTELHLKKSKRNGKIKPYYFVRGKEFEEM